MPVFSGAVKISSVGILATNSTPFFITSAIPLIPGSTLYYCMNAVVSSDLRAAEHFGEQTFLAALGIASGMAIAWCLADLSRKLHVLLVRPRK